MVVTAITCLGFLTLTNDPGEFVVGQELGSLRSMWAFAFNTASADLPILRSPSPWLYFVSNSGCSAAYIRMLSLHSLIRV